VTFERAILCLRGIVKSWTAEARRSLGLAHVQARSVYQTFPGRCRSATGIAAAAAAVACSRDRSLCVYCGTCSWYPSRRLSICRLNRLMPTVSVVLRACDWNVLCIHVYCVSKQFSLHPSLRQCQPTVVIFRRNVLQEIFATRGCVVDHNLVMFPANAIVLF